MEKIQEDYNNLLIESIKNNSRLSSEIKRVILPRYLSRLRTYHIVWDLLHSFSVFYPECPTENQKKNTKEILLKIKYDMPFCLTCSNNPDDNFIENSDLDLAVNNTDNLIQFLIDYHSFINRLTKNKDVDNSIYTVEFIKNKYNNVNYLDFFKNKYQLSFIEIISYNDISNFRYTMQTLGASIFSEINQMEYNISLNISIK